MGLAIFALKMGFAIFLVWISAASLSGRSRITQIEGVGILAIAIWIACNTNL